MWFITHRPSFPSLSSLFSSSSSPSTSEEAPTLTHLSRQIRQALKTSHSLSLSPSPSPSRPLNPFLCDEFSAWLDVDVGSYDLGKTRAVDKYVNLHPGLRREVRMNICGLYALAVERRDENDQDFEFEIARRIARLRALHAPGRRRSSSAQSFGPISSVSSIESR